MDVGSLPWVAVSMPVGLLFVVAVQWRVAVPPAFGADLTTIAHDRFSTQFFSQPVSRLRIQRVIRLSR